MVDILLPFQSSYAALLVAGTHLYIWCHPLLQTSKNMAILYLTSIYIECCFIHSNPYNIYIYIYIC